MLGGVGFWTTKPAKAHESHESPVASFAIIAGRGEKGKREFFGSRGNDGGGRGEWAAARVAPTYGDGWERAWGPRPYGVGSGVDAGLGGDVVEHVGDGGGR